MVGALPGSSIATQSFAFIGSEKATAATGVVDAITSADVVMLAPSNPIVSIGAILAIPAYEPRCVPRRLR